MTIDFNSLNVFKKFRSYAPWFDKNKNTYLVIITAEALEQDSHKIELDSLKEHAVDILFEHYLPEFYPFLQTATTKGDVHGQTYQILRSDLLNNIQYKKNDAPYDVPDDDTKYLFSAKASKVDFKQIRATLLDLDISDSDPGPEFGDCPPELSPPHQTPDKVVYPSGMPSFTGAIEALNKELRIPDQATEPKSTILISLGSMNTVIENLQSAIKTYDKQIRFFPTPLRLPLNLEIVQNSVQRVLNLIQSDVAEDIKLSGYPMSPFGEDDRLQIELDGKEKIQTIRYEVDLGDDYVDESLKVGYITLIKYNTDINDRWVMATLAKHQQILQNFRSVSPTTGPGLPSLIKFLDDTYGNLIKDPETNPGLETQPALSAATTVIPGIDSDQLASLFVPSGSKTQIDLASPTALANNISTVLTAADVGKIQSALQNPEVLASLYDDISSKQLSTTINLPKIIDKVIALIGAAQGQKEETELQQKMKKDIDSLEADLLYVRENYKRTDSDYPADMVKLKKTQLRNIRKRLRKTRFPHPPPTPRDASPCGVTGDVLSLLGIPELIIEALLCLTVGTNFSLNRINQAIELGFNIAEFVEDYESPPLPRPLLVMPDIPKIEITFSITGDPPLWKQILDIVLQTLAEVAFDIIKGIAEMIKNNCDNLLNRPEQMGQINLEAAVRQNLRGPAGPPTPSISQMVDDAFALYGLTQDEGYSYLGDLSNRLTPLEVCRLFSSPSDVADETTDKIRNFNLKSNNAEVSKIKSKNQILSFFQSMAQISNVTKVCNDAINGVDVEAALCNFCLNEADIATLADQQSIQKLVDLLDKDGIPVDVPEIDFLCPDNDKYLPNPIVSRVIPQTYNTLIENVKMQFVYSVEAARTTLLEPQIVVSEGSSPLMSVLQHTNALPSSPPEIDPAFLTILASLLEKMQDASFGIDPDVCADLDMSKFDVGLSDFLNVVGDLNVLMRDGLALAGGLVEDVTERIARIQDTLTPSTPGPAGIPYVTKVFPRSFYKHFSSMARNSPPEYRDIHGTSIPDAAWYVKNRIPGGERTYKSYVRKDKTTDQYGRLELKWYFLNALGSLNDKSIRVQYFSSEDISSGRPAARLLYPHGLLPGTSGGAINITVPDTSVSPSHQPFGRTSLTSVGTESGFNPYIYNFTLPLYKQLIQLGPPLSPADKTYLEDKLQKQLYPTVFNGLVKKTFEYVTNNGIFDMASLDSLNLFKDNANCTPSNAGDLLDIRGVLDQVKKSFRQAACHDPGTTQEKVTDALKLALINLLIQVHIVEFVVKNIFVFGAFKFSELMNQPVLSEMLTTTVTTEIEELIRADRPDLKEFIFKHFALVHERAPLGPSAGYPARQEDGITHSYTTPSSAVSFLSNESEIKKTSFEKLIRFLVEERLNHQYETCGETVTTVQTINNILKEAGATDSFEDIFIKDILEVYRAPYGKKDAPMKSDQGSIIFAKYVWWTGISNWDALATSEVLIPWPNSSPQAIADAQEDWDQAQAEYVAQWLATAEDWQQHSSFAQDQKAAEFVEVGGPRPDPANPRHIRNLQDILGTPGAAAMPIRTNTAIDFVDLMEMTNGPRPIFEGMKVGYKLIYNLPQYRSYSSQTSAATEANATAITPFILSFREGPVRDLMIEALKLQGRATEKDSILDSVQTDMQPGLDGSQIMGEMLSVDISAIGDFDGNSLADELNFVGPPPQSTPTGIGTGVPSLSEQAGNSQYTFPDQSAGTQSETIKYQKIKDFNTTPLNLHLGRIKEDPEYNRFINQTFNPELIMMMPLLYNLGLTQYFFGDIERDFKTTKNVILNLFETVDNTQSVPSIRHKNTADRLTNSLGSQGQSDMDENIREFILKALAETPIKILKGVVELADPHVAISKIIRDITGGAFLQITSVLDAGIKTAASAVPEEAGPLAKILKVISGEDLLALGFCGLNTMNEAASDAIPDLGPLEAPLLGPRLTLDGLDFTGTISGLLMMPPTPLGLIYLLIMLLEKQSEPSDDDRVSSGPAITNSAITPDSNEC